MSSSYRVFLIAAFLSCHWAEGAYRYELEIKKDEPLESCDLEAFTDLDSLLDKSDFIFDRDDDDIMVVSGTFKFKKDVGVLKMDFELKQFQHGNWVTLGKVIKEDTCEFITSPIGGAKVGFKNLEPKRCPFETDTAYSMEPTKLNFEINIPFAQAQGDTMAIIKFTNNNKNISTCVKIFGYIH